MPLYLPPISRRKFLRRAAAASAGLALAPKVFSAPKPKDENSWALLSDIHIAANRDQLGRGINMVEHFETVSREVLSLSKRPAGVFINGDCAFNSGESGDYKVVAELLQPLREAEMPIHLAVGNHDERGHFWSAFKTEQEAPKPVRGRQAALVPTANANWFILDSLEKTLSTPGLIGEEQLTWLAKVLDEHATKPALVMVHHNPGMTGNIGLKDTKAFFEVIRPRKQVKAYVFGHTHVWKTWQDESGIHFINLPAVGYVFKEGEPSGWVHADLGKDGMKLELRCVDQSHKLQGQVVDLKWRV